MRRTSPEGCRWATRAALLLGALALTGCSGLPPDAPVAVYDAEGGGMDALGGGVLAVVDDCLYFENAGGLQLALWPEGSIGWDDDVLTFDGERYQLGQRIRVGGGEVEVPDDATVPEGCDASGKAFLVADTPGAFGF